MPNFGTIAPIIISVALPLMIWWLTARNHEREKEEKDEADEGAARINETDRFHELIASRLDKAEQRNAELQADLFSCQQAKMELIAQIARGNEAQLAKALAEEVARLKQEKDEQERFIKAHIK